MPVGFAVKLNLFAQLALALLLCSWAGHAFAATPRIHVFAATWTSAGEGKTARPASEERQEAPSQRALEIARPFGFPITNSIVVSWIVAIGLIVFAQLATRNMKAVPDGAQNFWEWMVEGLYSFLEDIIGPHLVGRTFWFFASVFIFILSANWVGLIPGVGTIGWGHRTSYGFKVDAPFFRGANADVNLTLAMALVFFVCWI